MRRAFLLALVAALVGGCREGAPIPAVDVLLRVQTETRSVEVGRGFPLSVVRVWKKDLVPDDWSDRALSPLSVRLLDTSRREDAERVEETRRYVAHAFRFADVVVRPARFAARAKGGGEPRVAASESLRVHVVRTVDPAAPGEPEGPGEPIEPRPSRTPIVIACATLLVLAAAAAIVTRRRAARGRGRPPLPAPPPPVAPPVADPTIEAAARLEALRARGVDGPSRLAALEEASTIVRDVVERRFCVPAHERTTEEVLDPARGGPALPEDVRSALFTALSGCDRAKFSGVDASAGAFSWTLDACVRFVTAARKAVPA